jgi:hypothetical protein
LSGVHGAGEEATADLSGEKTEPMDTSQEKPMEELSEDSLQVSALRIEDALGV